MVAVSNEYMFQIETFPSCPAIPVTEKKESGISFSNDYAGCLIITVTENHSKLWSITLSGSEVLNEQSKDAVFFELASRYNWLTSKKEKMDFLQDIETQVLPKLGIKSMHRKSLIRRLRNTLIADVVHQRRGRKAKYNDIEKGHLVQLWKLTGYPCSKRLVALMSDWLAYYNCSDSIKKSLSSMSASQMDIFLKDARLSYLKKINSGTVPAKNHIKQLIRLRDPSVKYNELGYIESDTVLHCGDYIWGVFTHTVSATDLLSGWTCGRSIRGKNAELVVKELIHIKHDLPFAMKSLFFDNGIEFINHLLVQEMKNVQGVDVARGRSGRSNDQCHIEQKNNTFVRSLFGYVRIEDPDLVPLMNEIYDIWGKLHNYFLPQAKLISKDRVGAKVIKKYDKPKTPFQRIMESDAYPEEQKEQLRKIKATLNPIQLQAELQKKLAYFHKLNDAYNERIKKETS